MARVFHRLAAFGVRAHPTSACAPAPQASSACLHHKLVRQRLGACPQRRASLALSGRWASLSPAAALLCVAHSPLRRLLHITGRASHRAAVPRAAPTEAQAPAQARAAAAVGAPAIPAASAGRAQEAPEEPCSRAARAWAAARQQQQQGGRAHGGERGQHGQPGPTACKGVWVGRRGCLLAQCVACRWASVGVYVLACGYARARMQVGSSVWSCPRAYVWLGILSVPCQVPT